ncbi:D-arabinose 1-dehydrogenase-like Zn-dependent alcohol dehydrogenase [Streptomyces sp. V4I23]|nr:D-arabinose 1-dehydrogenase-like Zn-dependent alcohol dehydrogenase [Streptomyces sp. V4I23]
MRTALIEAPGQVAVATVPDPTPAPREGVVDAAACGLCGTDLHMLQCEFAPALPVVSGHAGEMIEIGSEVSELAVGYRVAVGPSLYCHECRHCRAGRANLCDRWNAIGVSVQGGAAEYALAPVANCVRLPDHVDVRDAARIDPLSCAVRGYDVLNSSTLDRFKVGQGRKMVVEP